MTTDNGNKNGKKSAFPQGYASEIPGLSKREYFAALAMQGLLANPNAPGFPDATKMSLSEMALSNADELLKQLEEK